jgi:hypothetical protein
MITNTRSAEMSLLDGRPVAYRPRSRQSSDSVGKRHGLRMEEGGGPVKITTTSNVAIRRAVTPSATCATSGWLTETVTGDQKKFNGKSTARRTQSVPRDLDHRRTPV